MEGLTNRYQSHADKNVLLSVAELYVAALPGLVNSSTEVMYIKLLTTFLAILTAQHGCTGYGRPYPVTGTWFKDRTNITDLNQTLTAFKSIGGDTALSRGAEFMNRTKEGVKTDPLFKDCAVGELLKYSVPA